MFTRRSRTVWSAPNTSRIRNSRYGHRWRCRRRSPTPRPRSTASRSALNLRRAIRPFWCWTANSRTHQTTACFSSRNAASPGTTRAARISNSCSGCSLRSRTQKPSCSFWAKPSLPSSRRASTLNSPMSAADSADATIPRSRCGLRWQGCSSRIVRSGLPTAAISSSRWASSGTHSKYTRRSGSIARAARLSHSPPTTYWMAAASPISRVQLRRLAPRWRSASMIFRESTLPQSPSTHAA